MPKWKVFEDLRRDAVFAGSAMIRDGAEDVSYVIGVADQGGLVLGGGELLYLPKQVMDLLCLCFVTLVEVSQEVA